MDDDFNIDDLLGDIFADMPREQRLGFYTSSSLDLKPDFAEVIEMLHRLLATEEYIDDEGYLWQIIAHTVDDDHRRLAWVEWRSQDRGRISYDNYYLKARDTAGGLRLWEIETYNPFFGCTVHFLDWVDDTVILIYEDKHDTFTAGLRNDRTVTRIEITPDWTIGARLLTYRNPAGEELGALQLPSLRPAE